jgi:CRP-like cAMP-binding protein
MDAPRAQGQSEEVVSKPFAEHEYAGGNAVLDHLPADERAELLPHLRVSTEEETRVLRSRDQPIEAVHFPIDCVYSIVVELAHGHTYEVDVVGRGGVIGAEVAIGARMAARTVLCQVGGRVARLPLEPFERAFAAGRALSAAVRTAMRRQWYVSQQTVACNFAHTPDQRAARWILMTHDQIGRDHFPLRAEYLSIMLGMSAPAVRGPLDILERLGCIRYADDHVRVLSRTVLHGYACECYELQRDAAFIGTNGERG